MKKILLSTSVTFLLLFLFLINGITQVVVKIPTPENTVVTYSSADSRAFALSGLTTYYSNINWAGGVSDSGCIYWGINDTLFNVINGNYLLPPDDTKPLDSQALATMSNLVFYNDPGYTNLANGQICFIGSTQIQEVAYYYSTLTLTSYQFIYLRRKSDNGAIPFEIVNGMLLAKIQGSDFYVTTELKLFWPYSGYPSTYGYSIGYNTYRMAIALYNEIHTNPYSSILSSWNGGDFYRIPFNVSFTKTDPACYGAETGAISSNVKGGFGAPYSFNWGATPNPTTQDQTGLKAGKYVVNITDNGSHCLITREVTLNQPDSLKANTAKTDVLCFGDSTATITGSPSGGKEPYLLEWYDGSTDASVSNLPVGIYSIKLTDFNNCETKDTVTISEPAMLESSFILASPICNYETDGQIIVAASGGIEPYNYVWNNGSSNDTVENVPVGEYSVTIKDQNLCSLVSHTALLSLSNITIHAVVSNVSCYGESNGTIQIEPSGGFGSYSILWSNGTAISENTGLAAGEYIANVKDDYGCVVEDTFIITEPEVLIANIKTTAVTCFHGSDGEVNLTVTGGSEPYSYLWSTEATSQDISALVANTYEVEVEDSNHCLVTASGIVPDGIPDIVSFNFSIESGTATFTNISGTGSFNWNFGDGSNSQETNPVHIFEANGIYSVCLNFTTGCGTVQSCKNLEIIGVSIKENSLKSISLYPNPVKDQFTLTWNCQEKPSNMIIYNALGVAILNMSVTANPVNANVSQIKPGMYYAKLVFTNHTEVTPLIISR